MRIRMTPKMPFKSSPAQSQAGARGGNGKFRSLFAANSAILKNRAVAGWKKNLFSKLSHNRHENVTMVGFNERSHGS